MNHPANNPPVVLAMEPAIAYITDCARTHCTQVGRGRAVVGITGPVGSGKSFLARKLSPCVLSTDDYLPNYSEVPYEDRDKPEMADFALLAANLSALGRGEPARVPIWSFQTHQRESWRHVESHSLVVCEGIHALNDRLMDVVDIGVFVEAPTNVRWSRWEQLELSGERGWGVEVAREYFHSVAEPTFARYENNYRSRALIVVRNG